MTRTTTRSATILAVLLVTAGCSGQSNGNDTGTSPDTGQRDTATDTRESGDTGGADGSDTPPSDAEPPELRDVSAAIQGEFSSQVDLNGDSEIVRYLPIDAKTEFTVFASDNETDAENLTLEAVDAEGNALEKVEENFRNGLWRFTVDVGPGTTVAVEATDEAGNTSTTDAKLVIPSRGEALVDDWQRREFSNDDQSITARFNLTFRDDGTWQETTPDAEFSGSYGVDDRGLAYTVESISGKDGEPSRTVSSFYVDETYYDHNAWTLADDSNDKTPVAATWERNRKIYGKSGGDWELAKEISETLELKRVEGGDDTWTLTRTGTDHTGGSKSDIDETESGTWQIIENDSYAGNYGNYLKRTTTHRNGSKLDSAETVTELFQNRLDKLLISPYLRSPEKE